MARGPEGERVVGTFIAGPGGLVELSQLACTRGVSAIQRCDAGAGGKRFRRRERVFADMAAEGQFETML
jgi:hypothetical protein